MSRQRIAIALVAAAAWGAVAGPARGQAPTIETVPLAPGQRGQVAPPQAGSLSPRFGAVPGAGADVLGRSPGVGDQILGGGRPGPSVPRVPQSITMPGGMAQPLRRGIAPPLLAAPAPLPTYGTLELPVEPVSDGPPDGLTLDMAIDRLLRANLDLLSSRFEIPQAQADILTAGLRANPLLYADAQLVPYGEYSAARPGGQTQYDLNISWPIDISRKYRARTAYSTRFKNVLEAQFQDSVRLAIDNLYIAYVDVLAARETVAFTLASIRGYDELIRATEELRRGGEKTSADIFRLRGQRNLTQVALADAESTLRRAKRTLGALLTIPPEQADRIELRGSLRDTTGLVPDRDGLVRLALEARPDLAANRLGIGLAQANVRLQKANRYSDIYLLYQPYTFQNNAPLGLKSPTSWALGVTVPLPIVNRNQGNIRRAELNVTQSKVELDALALKVATEVRQAIQEYELTSVAVRDVARVVLPDVKRAYESIKLQHTEREDIDILMVLTSRQEYNDAVRRYRDFQVRHRRAMLSLNTAVGRRVLP
jgi:cobalt-zinc-cadmium efflux system outer membrane protein